MKWLFWRQEQQLLCTCCLWGPHQIWETNQTVQLLHKAPGQSACYSNLNPIHLGNSGVQVSPRIRQHVDSTYTPATSSWEKRADGSSPPLFG